jgi:hypothetical protein
VKALWPAPANISGIETQLRPQFPGFQLSPGIKLQPVRGGSADLRSSANLKLLAHSEMVAPIILPWMKQPAIGSRQRIQTGHVVGFGDIAVNTGEGIIPQLVRAAF